MQSSCYAGEAYLAWLIYIRESEFCSRKFKENEAGTGF